jgi:virginiamycin B lyase
VRLPLCALLAVPLAALAGGSNYGVTSGAKDLTGKISEWPVPTPQFARDPAIGPEGSIYIDTVALLDPANAKFQVFKLPSKSVGIRKAIIDGDGRFWYMGSHNGRLGVIE